MLQHGITIYVIEFIQYLYGIHCLLEVLPYSQSGAAQSGLCYLNSSDRSFKSRRGVLLVFIQFNANSIDSDQMPHSVVSEYVWLTQFANIPFMGH